MDWLEAYFRCVAIVLSNAGGACSVVGTKVASQGSVAHQDLAQTIAQLNLWTLIGGAIGSTIATAVYTSHQRENLVKAGFSADKAATYSKSYKYLLKFPYGSPERIQAINAFNMSMRPLYIAATCVSVVCLIFACFMPNFYLGKTHNKVENTDPAGRKVEKEWKNLCISSIFGMHNALLGVMDLKRDNLIFHAHDYTNDLPFANH